MRHPVLIRFLEKVYLESSLSRGRRRKKKKLGSGLIAVGIKGLIEI